MKRCEGSGSHVGITVGQRTTTAGAVRPNVATQVRCPACSREFATARISYTDHGIPTQGRAMIPNHNREGA